MSNNAIKKTDKENGIDHPGHYNRNPSGVECIDIIEHMSLNIGSAMGYLWRHEHKGEPIKDLRKAIWYIKREIKRIKREHHV